MLDGAAEAAVRAALNGEGGRVEFEDPATVHSVPAFTVAARWVRLSRRASGRTTVIGQEVAGLPGCGDAYWARLCCALEIASAGLPITVLCPRASTGDSLPRTRATHTALLTADGSRPNPDHRSPAETVAGYPPPPPPDLGTQAAELPFGAAELPAVRHLVATVAGPAQSPARVADLVLAANEIATNTVEHGSGSGRLRIWSAGDVTVEVTDVGRLDAPFPGLAAPSPSGTRGRGLWLASELCDVLEVWNDDSGSVIRLRMTS